VHAGRRVAMFENTEWTHGARVLCPLTQRTRGRISGESAPGRGVLDEGVEW
jgi:hypothetical protein